MCYVILDRFVLTPVKFYFLSSLPIFSSSTMSQFSIEKSEQPSFQTVSARAQRLITGPALPYVQELVKSLSNQYHPIDNPTGAVLLAVAENKLCTNDIVLPKIREYCGSEELPVHTLNYTSTFGLPEFRKSLASFMAEYLFHFPANGGADGSLTINPDHIVVGAGCVAHLTSLSLLLFNPGDALLCPVPYYPAFDKDFLNFGDAVVMPVFGEKDAEVGNDAFELFGRLTEKSLDEALANAAPRPVKALLLSNPSNPLGTLYTREELLVAIEWCRRHRIHLIMDEIYALSIFPTTANGDLAFASIVELTNNQLGDYLHFVWSFSKDFSASGYRVGVMYTQNQSLLSALSATNDAMMASNLTQYAMQRMIEDRSFIDLYLQVNSKRLHKSYSLLKDTLTQIGVRVLSAQGAIFAFCDFRKYLDTTIEEKATADERKTVCYAAERRLFSKLVQAGVLFTPGESCHCPYPGFFRVCYAFVSYEGLEEGLRRVKQILMNV